MKIKQIILILALSSLFAGCNFFDSCENVTSFEVSSNEYTATAFNRGCCPLREHSFVNVRKFNQKFDFEDEKKQVFLSLKHNDGIALNWKNDSTLVVKCDDCLEDGLEKVTQDVKLRFDDLKIEYQTERTPRK